MAKRNYMGEEELLEWGRGENRARMQDLTGIASAADLQWAKDEAGRRRRDAGLTRGDAVRAVKLAQMEARAK